MSGRSRCAPHQGVLLTYADVKARNVGGFAPGEFAEMPAAGNAVGT